MNFVIDDCLEAKNFDDLLELFDNNQTLMTFFLKKHTINLRPSVILENVQMRNYKFLCDGIERALDFKISEIKRFKEMFKRLDIEEYSSYKEVFYLNETIEELKASIKEKNKTINSYDKYMAKNSLFGRM